MPREVSPRRLVFYRDNWYLDAWYHLRKGLRSFSVDAIREVEPLDRNARNVTEQALEPVMDILCYGPDVELVKPAGFREKVRGRLWRAGAVYGN